MTGEPAALRILDANLNRACEALRTIEDYARFGLDDRASAADAKGLRHRLRSLSTGIAGLLAARDIESDVGRDAKTPGELRRAHAREVAAAAFSRAAEALRSVGEYAKSLARADAAAEAERLRYELYALEPRVLLRGSRVKKLRAAGLYVILTEQFCRRNWRDTATAVLRAGCRCVQLREKSLSDRELAARAGWLRDETARYDALLVLNDRPDIARLCRADGVHVGQDDLPLADARAVVGGEALLGKSTHDLSQFRMALEEAPDYIAVGPMFATRTKNAGLSPGPALLHEARPLTELPLAVISGIDAGSAGDLARAGADLICVCAAVVSQDDPGEATAAFQAELRRARTSLPRWRVGLGHAGA